MPWIDQDIKNEIRLKKEIYDKAKQSGLHVYWDLCEDRFIKALCENRLTGTYDCDDSCRPYWPYVRTGMLNPM